ncbi:MAG: hypothetical protein HYW78_04760 [Parcubacteria group bacterium]|nr:hypothetical protein [Parcubacteria group bacterium]
MKETKFVIHQKLEKLVLWSGSENVRDEIIDTFEKEVLLSWITVRRNDEDELVVLTPTPTKDIFVSMNEDGIFLYNKDAKPVNSALMNTVLIPWDNAYEMEYAGKEIDPITVTAMM